MLSAVPYLHKVFSSRSQSQFNKSPYFDDWESGIFLALRNWEVPQAKT